MVVEEREEVGLTTGGPEFDFSEDAAVDAAGVPVGMSRVRKWRSSVDSEGASPRVATMIRRTWAAVRAGFSRFSVPARASTPGAVTGPWVRPAGLSASNPPRRQVRIHRSMVSLDTCTISPNGPGCTPASARTIGPR